MVSLRSPWALLLLTPIAVAFAAAAAAPNVTSIENLSLEGLEEKLQTCSIVQDLNAHRAANSHEQSTFFRASSRSSSPEAPPSTLFSRRSTSRAPNFLLALCPTNIDPASLTIMVAFAVGGLMGDTLFHLLPEIFLGEEEHGKVKFVLVEPNRNLLLGLAILVGFMTFVAMDKGLRILTGGAGHDHGHGHSHSHSHEVAPSASSSSVDAAKGGAKSRKKGTAAAEKDHDHAAERKEVSPSMKMGGVLNLIADFTHNITDGLAMAASFYASPTVGASTTLAVFLHEIPHEVGDFALLVQSGFSKRAAMGAQFVTAIGAFSAPSSASAFRTVIPELLETGPNKTLELKKTLGQFTAVALGAGIMLYISWHD
ncbi:unnamed protein product [Parascedosporium putredinis]|uniref:Uncharacterized protein n=1 Tax=Parascedosporium putredinis TaxID=1442378 RepID=A0A9P1M714_9PEZI|nr:unnamed protein product [Parascedosporium putredinis]CAI7987716.1 unnamed protein product [Parascedosporium putredinis]